jgi:hypothetical protein
VEPVHAVNAVVKRVVVLLNLDFLLFFGLLCLLLVSDLFLADNHNTSALGLLFPTLFLLQVDILSLDVIFGLLAVVSIHIWSDILTVLDHELAKVNGSPIWITVDEGLLFGLKFLFSFLFSLLSLLFLLLALLSSLLSLFELLLLLLLFLLALFLSSLFFLLSLLLVCFFFLDVLNVAKEILLIFKGIDVLEELLLDFVHLLLCLLLLGIDFLDLNIVFCLDVINALHLSDHTFLLLSFLLKLIDFSLQGF